MGYTRIIQYADITEKYDYQKPYNKPRKAKKRRRIKPDPNKPRIISRRSRTRTRKQFFNLVHHNNHWADTISFLTVTYYRDYSYSTCLRHVAEFYRRLRKIYALENTEISYIAVPEKTKKGRIHLHVLLYNLPAEDVQNERYTRNLQVNYRRGYLDIRLATKKSPAIAGYMAKYLAKSLEDTSTTAGRFYNTSRNIKKITSFGYNQDYYPKDIIENNLPDIFVDKYEYDTMYLGKCIKTITKLNI